MNILQLGKRAVRLIGSATDGAAQMMEQRVLLQRNRWSSVTDDGFTLRFLVVHAFIPVSAEW